MATECDESSLNESQKMAPIDTDVDSLVSSVHCQRLFRLFLLFAGNQLFWHAPGGGRLLRFIRRTQSQFILGQMCQIRDQMQINPIRQLPSFHSEEDAHFGIADRWDEVGAVQNANSRNGKCESAEDEEEMVTFRLFLRRIGALLLLRRHFEPIVDRLFARYVLQLIRRGFLFGRKIFTWSKHSKNSPADGLLRWQEKKRKTFSAFCHCPGETIKWHTFWCVLVPGQMNLWPQRIGHNYRINSSKATRKIALKLQRETFVKYVNEESEVNENGTGLFGWHLVTCDGIYEFAHFDQLQRELWIADIELAIRKRNPSLLCQFDRANSFRQTTEDILRKKLENEKRELEKALEREREALEDEEHIRQMATRMLDEEISKGQRLSRTVQTLQEQLEREKRQRLTGERRQTNGKQSDQKQHQRLAGEGMAAAQLSLLATIRRRRPVTPTARTKRSKRRTRDELRRREQQQQKEKGREEGEKEQKDEKKKQEEKEEKDDEKKEIDNQKRRGRKQMTGNGRRPSP